VRWLRELRRTFLRQTGLSAAKALVEFPAKLAPTRGQVTLNSSTDT
jgi:hypothetical protein